MQSGSEAKTNILEEVERIESWRRANDIIYRLLTQKDATELHQVTSGLVNPHAENLGLLYTKYPRLRTTRCQSIFSEAIFGNSSSTLETNEEYRRTSAQFLVFAALAIESEFVQYITKHTYDRNKLREFVTQTLTNLVVDLLQGTLVTGNSSGHDLIEFVNKARTAYMLYCIPIPTPTTGPAPCLDAAR